MSRLKTAKDALFRQHLTTKTMATSYFVFLFLLLIIHGVNGDEDDKDDDLDDDEDDSFSVADCNLKVKPGSCMAYMPRWYFNKTWNNCTKFIYGGCRGNKNNFGSKHECEKKCLGTHGHSAHQSSIGDQQQLQGPCIQASKAFQQTHVLNILLPSLYHNKYIPQCNRHGYFKPMQCNRHRTKCWCVDKWGNKKGKHSKGHPDDLDCS
ncbi:uncharacterized protein [Porites lutea]|uniref:uncharacterized protein n=1 Tax=Porites lutea TaxID=51062 RepID=UPI003CC58C5E